jgi:hypothetical protein
MVNLFSLTAVMEKNFAANGTKDGIVLKKGDWSVKFDIKFGTPKGHVFGAMILPYTEDIREEVQVNLPAQLNYETAHQLLGHPGRNILVGTCDRLQVKLSERQAQECEDCQKERHAG